MWPTNKRTIRRICGENSVKWTSLSRKRLAANTLADRASQTLYWAIRFCSLAIPLRPHVSGVDVWECSDDHR